MHDDAICFFCILDLCLHFVNLCKAEIDLDIAGFLRWIETFLLPLTSFVLRVREEYDQ
jgi:hypothetical protein